MGRAYRSERGQAIVLIVLAIVGLMGFAALAVDLGRVYSERRRAQNAADSGALAAAYAAARDEDYVDAASAVLDGNGFIVNGTDVIVNHPPAAPSPYQGNPGYYQVVIHLNVPSIFSQFVYHGSMAITVEAVSHAQASHGIADGLSVVALDKTVCPGLTINGNAEINIVGGGIFSNSVGTAAHNCSSGIATGTSGFINVTDGSVQTAGNWIANPGYPISPTVEANVATRDFEMPPVPDCSKHANQTVSGNILQPGQYHRTAQNQPALDLTGGAYNMAPGLYCIYGDFKMNSGILRGNGVTIVMYEGALDWAGKPDIKVSAPAVIEDDRPEPEHYNGMLLYMPENNTNGIDIGGSSGSTYSGTIYAPGPRLTAGGNPSPVSKCNLGGTTHVNTDDIYFNSSIMCYNIEISGNPTFNMTYNDSMNYKFKPRIDLSQ